MVRFIGVAPQGGVWVLELGGEGCSRRKLGRINNARDMEEKCKQIDGFECARLLRHDFSYSQNVCRNIGQVYISL